jgi:hypothetical protein
MGDTGLAVKPAEEAVLVQKNKLFLRRHVRQMNERREYA